MSSAKSSTKLFVGEWPTIYQSEDSLNVEEENYQDPFAPTIPTWSARYKCLMAYLCLILNFSNIIRYTYSLGIYGSTIFIPYILFTIFIGLPIVMTSVTLGRFVTGNFVRIFLLCPLAKGIFVCFFFNTSLAIFTKYTLLVHLFKYATSLLTGGIDWEKCSQPWANINCYEVQNNISSFLHCFQNFEKMFCLNLDWQPSAKQYWEKVAANAYDSESATLTIVFLIISIIIVTALTYKGIRGLEKLFIYIVTVSLILASILIMASFLIPGSVYGFRDVWFLDLSLLMKPDIWILGLEDVVVRLSLGIFGLPFISSHGKFTDDIAFDVIVIIFCDIFSCLILTVPFLGVIQSITSARTVLTDYLDTYIWISEALIFFPPPNNFWAFAYFLEMLILEFGSQCVLCLAVSEAISYLLQDRFSMLHISAMVGIISFVCTVPFAFLPQMLTFPFATAFMTAIFLDLITTQTFYGTQKLIDDFHFMMGYHPSIIFSYARILASLIIAICLLIEIFLKKPNLFILYGLYFCVAISAILYLIVAVLEIYKAHKQNKISKAFQVNPTWGPRNQILKQSRIVFNSKFITKEFMYRQELYKKPLVKPNDFSEQNIVNLL